MNPSPRKPWIAVVLALACPGLGHLYCGRIAACLVLFALSSAVFPAGLAAAVAPPSDAVFGVFCASAAGMVLVAAYSVIDAWRIARRTPADFTPRDFQRPAVYAVFIAAAIACPSAWAWLHGGRFFRAYVVASGSMSPALAAGDRVLSNGARLQFRPVQRFDVVTYLTDAGSAGKQFTYVKRVVGLPGERVESRDGALFVNGTRVASEGAGAAAAASAPFAADVPAGQCFVVGDSPTSLPGALVGLDAITGVVEYRYWSNGVGRLGIVR